MTEKLCPCCSGKSFAICCEPFLTGTAIPATAEQLMRSRYTAYAQANITYIEKTMRGEALQNFNALESSAWAKRVTWLELVVLKTGQDTVTFIARFQEDGKPRFIYEASQFEHVENQWFYSSGKQPKISRNSPCPCGSGKKFKSCCHLKEMGVL